MNNTNSGSTRSGVLHDQLEDNEFSFTTLLFGIYSTPYAPINTFITFHLKAVVTPQEQDYR